MGACPFIKNAKVSRVWQPPVTVTIHKQFSCDLIVVHPITDAGKGIIHLTASDVIGTGGKPLHKQQQAANDRLLHAFGNKLY
jgi:hypothetical protein